MTRISGYWRTLQQYWATQKGRHDIKDYAAALMRIIVTVAAAWLIVKLIN